MEAIRYLSAFRLYGADVLILALGVSLFTSLLKKTVLKSVSKKVFVFLPYLLGLVVYLIYSMIVTLSVEPLTVRLSETFEGGFAVGCAATLYYVVYEQFFRANKKGVTVLTPLLDGIIPEENLEEVANEILGVCENKTQEEAENLVKEILARYGVSLTDRENEIYCKLVASYLFALKI